MLEAKGVSLWLEPAEPECTRLQRLIASLAQNYGSPPFAPHVTLVGEFAVDDEALACEMTAQLAASEHPFPLTLTAIEMEDVYWRTFYLSAEHSQRLDGLHARACSGFRVGEKSYRPHLSLMYTDLDKAARRDIAGRLSLPLPITVVAQRLALWRTTGSVGRWRQIASFGLADRRVAWR